MNASKNWIRGIDSLRFVLALIVVLHHLENPYAQALKNSSPLFGKYLGVFLANLFNGPAAVIAFFVISGFVVHNPIKNKDYDIKKFLIRRWVRIGIPLIVVSTVAYFYDNFVITTIWSLYCELVYYTIYPILRKIKGSWRLKFQISFAIYLIMLFIFCQNDIKSLVLHKDLGYWGTYWQLGNYRSWIMGLPAWILGVLIAEKLTTENIKNAAVTFRQLVNYRMGAFTLSVVLEFLKFHSFVSDMIVLNFFALLLFVWIQKEIYYYQNHAPNSQLEYGGKFSYSLYLVHGMCIKFILSFLALNIYTYPIFLVLIVGLSYLTYLLVENPSHKLAQKLANGQWLMVNEKKLTINH